MTKANPPPRECILDALIAEDGDNWALWALLQYPGLLMRLRWHSEDCNHCADVLERLFPEGCPESEDPADYNPPELGEILKQLREDTGKSIDTPL